MEQNNHDELNTFGRKIDVLLDVKHTNIALNSNEWQQSKNIRTNGAILNNLYIITQGDLQSIMAMDVIGKLIFKRAEISR